MNPTVLSMLRSAAVLGGFAVIGVALVAITHAGTRERIAENERAALLASLNAVVRPELHDNELFSDALAVRDPEAFGSAQPVTVYRARMQGRPVAAILTPTAPDGYNGSIRLVVGIGYDGRLTGVRVVAHQETPGLGDGIEERKSSWIHLFDGRSLENPRPERWRLKKDGGEFDQLTGATITPRAVVAAVYRSLAYYAANRDALFAEPALVETR